ncbi:reverse transcriptase domain-containing protein [Tanacetum coccineum]
MPTHKAKKKGASTGQEQSNPGGSYQVSGSRNHKGSTLPRLALKPSHGKETRWQLEDVCGLRRFKQMPTRDTTKYKWRRKTRKKWLSTLTKEFYSYTKMPQTPPLRTGATYHQRSVDKAFEKQIGRNLEVYVDDLVIKSHTEHEILKDVEETFHNLRRINMKLDPKKCTFGAEEGVFLGHIVSMQGIKACPEKAEAVMKLQSPQTLKEAQSLNGKLASLNMFLSKSAEKTLPFFKTLKRCVKKSDFQSTPEAERAFQNMKNGSSKRGPFDGKGLTASTSLFRESCLVNPRNQLQFNEKTSFSVSARHEEAEEILPSTPGGADFFAETPDKEGPLIKVQAEEAIHEPWTLFTDGSSCLEGSGAGLILTSPEGEEFTYALRKCDDCQTHRPVPRNPQQKLTPITSPWPLYKWGIDISGPFPEAQGKVKLLIIAIDYFIKWIEAKPVATITGRQVKKFVWDNIVYRFGLSGEIISDNEKQFRDNPFKDRYEKLNIKQRFASVKHPQTNGQVERANCGLGEGIKARLGEDNRNWVEEVPHIMMPSIRCAEVNQAENDKELLLNLDILEERREKAAVREAKNKAKMEKYYNAKVRSTRFCLGDFVYHSNKASHAKESGELVQSGKDRTRW